VDSGASSARLLVVHRLRAALVLLAACSRPPLDVVLEDPNEDDSRVYEVRVCLAGELDCEDVPVAGLPASQCRYVHTLDRNPPAIGHLDDREYLFLARARARTASAKCARRRACGGAALRPRRSDGTGLSCWGRADFHQVRDTGNHELGEPVEIASNGDLGSIRAGGHHTSGLLVSDPDGGRSTVGEGTTPASSASRETASRARHWPPSERSGSLLARITPARSTEAASTAGGPTATDRSVTVLPATRRCWSRYPSERETRSSRHRWPRGSQLRHTWPMSSE
jgi:hypothetical protein